MLQEKMVDLKTKEVTFRDYSKEEMKEVEIAQTKAAAIIQEQNTKAADKAALLVKLGITEDEARLLLS
jgi:hypothetical protein